MTTILINDGQFNWMANAKDVLPYIEPGCTNAGRCGYDVDYDAMCESAAPLPDEEDHPGAWELIYRPDWDDEWELSGPDGLPSSLSRLHDHLGGKSRATSE